MKSVLASYTLSLAVFIPISGWMADRFGTRRVFASAIGAVHAGLAAVRPGDQHPHAGRLPRPAGLRRRHDGAGRAHDHGAHLRQVGAGPRHELRGHPGPGRPDARARRRRADRRTTALERHLLRQRAGRPARALLRLALPARLPRATRAMPLDIARPGAVRRAASRCCPMCWRCSASTGWATSRCWGCSRSPRCCWPATASAPADAQYPLLRLACSGSAPFAPRSSGSFFTRLGLGGMPFLFPLLYQIGLGFSPIQSGLLVMPQAIAAMGLKLIMPAILARLRLSHRAGRQHADPRRLIMLFATIGAHTPVVADRAAGLRPAASSRRCSTPA